MTKINKENEEIEKFFQSPIDYQKTNKLGKTILQDPKKPRYKDGDLLKRSIISSA
jgi:hypothetical protein